MADKTNESEAQAVSQVVCEAWLRHAQQSADASAEIDEEELALLAAGEIDRLPQERQDELLRRVAAQPWAAQVVKEIADMGGGASEDENPNNQTGPSAGPVTTMRIAGTSAE